MGAFGYSDQEGAGAFSQEKKLPEREIERRRKHLMGIQRKISKRKKKAWWARNLIWCSKASPKKAICCSKGRTPMHAPEIDGKVFVNDVPEGLEPKTGEFYRCQVTEAHDYDLVARIV